MEDDKEDLDTFTNVLRTRHYNVGYREGLFKGKSEVIQKGFDRGYRLGCLLALLRTLKTLDKEEEEEDETLSELVEMDEIVIVEEIEKIREELANRIPEIKIATNLFADL